MKFDGVLVSVFVVTVIYKVLNLVLFVFFKSALMIVVDTVLAKIFWSELMNNYNHINLCCNFEMLTLAMFTISEYLGLFVFACVLYSIHLAEQE